MAESNRRGQESRTGSGGEPGRWLCRARDGGIKLGEELLGEAVLGGSHSPTRESC